MKLRNDCSDINTQVILFFDINATAVMSAVNIHEYFSLNC